MKKLYTIGVALSMVAFGTQSFAQVNKTVNLTPEYPVAERTTSPNDQLVKGNLDTKSTDAEVYWSEDFSNGFDGQEDNGAWAFDLANGELWFQTFPEGQPGAYDPDAPLVDVPAYTFPNSAYYGGSAVNSPTRNNGFMMIDATRWDLAGNPAIISALVSPSIDLSGQGITNANLVFYQRLRMCCAGSGLVANAEVSIDGGVTWVPYDVFYPFGDTNDNINREIRLDISATLQGAAIGNDLSDVKVRFLWAGDQTNYFWQIDDVSIQALEDNDLDAGKTWYNNYSTGLVDYNQGVLDGEEYLRTFENSRTPVYYSRPLTFGMAVTNKGFETQTGVQVVVKGVKPDGTTWDIGSTDAVDMAYGLTDTLNLAAYSIPDVQPGLYQFAYTVIQNEADSRPASNVGDTTVTRFTDQNNPDNAAVMQNTRNVNGGVYPFADNIIFSTAYSFPETAEGVGPKAITHVEAVFMFTPDFAPTVVGTTVYFNVRKGSLIDEDPDVPSTVTTVLFGNDPLNYEGIDIEFTISEDDIYYSADGMASYHYASFELPTPVLIEPNTAYQAEVRIPFGNLVYVPIASPEETYGSLVYLFNYNSNAPNWYTLGNNVMPLRFKIANGDVGIEKITYETGITLVQNYPNPFVDVTNIQFSLDKSDNVKLEVRDLSGKLVFQKDMGTVAAGMPQSYELQRGNLASGMYTYSIVTSQYQVSRKLTVQ